MLEELVALEELCSELDEATLELESSGLLLDELIAVDELEIAEELEIEELEDVEELEIAEELESFDELDCAEELDEATPELESSGLLLDELVAVDELELFDELGCTEELENCDELDCELDESAEDDDLTVMSTLKVMYSLSEDSVMLESAIFISLSFQKTNLLNSVTCFDPGNASDGVAVLPDSG